jgi:NADPH-dependent glutamate synthase beta subunit-like oxidoreductase
VDARGYVGLTRQGRFREALQLVRDKLPFPGILGYVCSHPCELHCKRIDEDSAVRIRDLKRFLAEWEPGEPRHRLETEPARVEKTAVVGAGPAGLLAAHDLRKRGYEVTVFERLGSIGGCLSHKIPSWRLPRYVVERDLSIIEALGIETRTGVTVGETVGLEQLCREYQAVLLLVGYDGARRLVQSEARALRASSRDTLWVDPSTCETNVPGVFAGGDAVSGPGTVVEALSLGRRAAESAHRFLCGEAQRLEREAPLPPRLLWTLDIPEAERQRRERTPVLLVPHGPGLDAEQAVQEAERCLDCECSLCVKDCEFLAAHCQSPREVARTVRRDLADPQTLRLIYSCNLCSLCGRLCPEQLDTGELLREARRRAVRGGFGPLRAHRGAVRYWRLGVSRIFTLAASEPGRVRSKRLFFPGCGLPAIPGPQQAALLSGLRSARHRSGYHAAAVRGAEEAPQQHRGADDLLWGTRGAAGHGGPGRLLGGEDPEGRAGARRRGAAHSLSGLRAHLEATASRAEDQKRLGAAGGELVATATSRASAGEPARFVHCA